MKSWTSACLPSDVHLLDYLMPSQNKSPCCAGFWNPLPNPVERWIYYLHGIQYTADSAREPRLTRERGQREGDGLNFAVDRWAPCRPQCRNAAIVLYIRHFATPFKNGRRGVSTSFRNCGLHSNLSHHLFHFARFRFWLEVTKSICPVSFIGLF